MTHIDGLTKTNGSEKTKKHLVEIMSFYTIFVPISTNRMYMHFRAVRYITKAGPRYSVVCITFFFLKNIKQTRQKIDVSSVGQRTLIPVQSPQLTMPSKQWLY